MNLTEAKKMWIEMTKTLVQQRAMLIETDVVNELGAEFDPLQQCIESACAEVRTAVVQGGGTIGTTTELFIPPSLVNCALSIIVYHFASRALRDSLLVQDSRYQAYARALETLDDVRSGKVRVENPDGEITGNAGVSIVKACPRPRMAGIETL